MIIRPSTPADNAAVATLLAREKLPTDIVDDEKGEIWVLEDHGTIAGSGALEIYGADALLRSVAVDPSQRGTGLGTTLVKSLEKIATDRDVTTLWLLTETAETFFAKRGYEKVDRSEVMNRNLLDSAEFTHLCASTAVCMKKRLQRSGVGEQRAENGE